MRQRIILTRNDTVEDSIEVFFGKIPLYSYLNALLAPTAAERNYNIIRGAEAFFNGIENLPYTSSVAGDIAIVPPYGAFAPEELYATEFEEPALERAGNNKIQWDSWQNYEKVTANGQQYAKVGDRLYSKHAVERMQPSGNRFGPNIYQGLNGSDYGRSIAPQYVEDVISSTKGVFQPETGNYVHVLGTVKVIVNPEGAVVTIMTYQ